MIFPAFASFVYSHKRYFSFVLSFLLLMLLTNITRLQFLPDPNRYVQAKEALVAIKGMTPPLLPSSHLQGPANTHQHIALSIGLQPHNQPDLHSSLQAYTPETAIRYHHFLTATQYATRYSPTETTYEKINHFLQRAGFTITHTYNHRLLLDFSGTIGQVEQAFHVTLSMYSGPDGKLYYANTSDPLLPVEFANDVIAINGLDNALHWHPTQLLAHHISTNASLSPFRSCPQHNKNYMTPDQFAGAYNINKLYTAHNAGEGQTVALFELSPFVNSDIATYTNCFGKSNTHIQAIPVGKNLIPDEGSLEVETDAELILSIAPHLKTLKIYEAGNDVTSYLSQWARIIQDNPPIISTSWGLCENVLDTATIRQENILFTAAAAQGQTIFASTGDTGSAGCLGNSATPPAEASVDDPASQPFVTAVGGSSLTLKGLSAYGSETTWNTTKGPPTGFNGASGGGISRYWTGPLWQKMTGVHNTYSTNRICRASNGRICRETPDVSLHANANHGYVVYCSAKATKNCSNSAPWNVVGGTSASAPLWAAVVALANEISLKQGGSTLGFINPLLYQIARDPQKYTACFHDIWTGNNDNNGLNGGRYPATRGYDMATGLGSYNAYDIALALVALAKKQGPN